MMGQLGWWLFPMWRGTEHYHNPRGIGPAAFRAFRYAPRWWLHTRARARPYISRAFSDTVVKLER